MITPHTIRGSIWDHLTVVTFNIFHFKKPHEDENSVPALILAADLPELLFVINHDIKSKEELRMCRRYYPTEIDSLTRTVQSLIDQSELPIYLQDTRMRVREHTPVHESDVCLVRLDDVANMCSENGIEISYMIPPGYGAVDGAKLNVVTLSGEAISDQEVMKILDDDVTPELQYDDFLLGPDWIETIWEHENMDTNSEITYRAADKYLNRSTQSILQDASSPQVSTNQSHVEFSRKGGLASHKEDSELRIVVYSWCKENRKKYKYRAGAARVAVKLVPAVLRSVEAWISYWESQNPGWESRNME